MKTKNKNIWIMAGILFLGFLLGWLVFGGSSKPAEDHVHEETDSRSPSPSSGSGQAKAEVWTCSMHPQIRQNEPGQCPICGMDLIPMDENASGGDPAIVEMSENAVKLSNIRTMTVGRQNAEKVIRLNGKVMPDERKVYAQTTHIPGRIERLTVNFTGESVRRGQTLAVVYSPDLVTGQEELLQAYAIKDAQPELFEAAKQKLRNWKISESQINKIINNRTPIQRFPIGADVNGIVTEKKAELGDYVERGTPLYEIADLSGVWVLFDVYESEMAWVKEGSTINYTIASLPGETFEGVVSFIDPLINAQTRVATARVEVSNKDGRLKPEMFASGEVQVVAGGEAQEEITVPKTAVLWTGERSVVYTKEDAGGKIGFRLREVTLGPSLGSAYIVKSGLSEGEEIVVNGTFTVDAAAQLAGKPSMMNPEGGSGSTGHQHGNMDMPASGQDNNPVKMKVSAKAKTALQKITETYLKLKDALTNDDFAVAQKELVNVSSSVSAVDMSLFKGTSHDRWMDLQKELERHSEAMGKAADVEAMRKPFKPFSGAVIRMATTFGPFSVPLYVQHCPMADSDKGADWLSLSEEIRNPYFGEKMLKCGEVTSEIK
ncbi:efflux RND transporter periplasmic adaptor subunit [Sinomicrobium weinanense]|uniref:Efflux RND transporter periplasmic adaptor subunit n=1 Tax=Sinomicrobium weinanense TaxID=2842200 RepID=A0A926Q3L9_9FLAO|nr:efflux RND transporter periplasmic adaptor subunit [Sinomicrobium weinanense]MBC9795925.1 efflux RND transporter periplasmic adaptor subunit [Sinomicrobium weinanense]MBU3124696.1 efflux RND transporter periplasmic adaptor subunit [Sinomicrobium weinanense]